MCLGYVMSLIPHHSAGKPTIPNEPNELATKKRRIQQERASVSVQVEALTTAGMLVLESIGIDVGLSSCMEKSPNQAYVCKSSS
jgi:hypothetical protein